jgi:hypothetical protein
VIRAEAIARLRASEDWEAANRKAAEFWTESVKTVETVEIELLDKIGACCSYKCDSLRDSCASCTLASHSKKKLDKKLWLKQSKLEILLY